MYLFIKDNKMVKLFVKEMKVETYDTADDVFVTDMVDECMFQMMNDDSNSYEEIFELEDKELKELKNETINSIKGSHEYETMKTEMQKLVTNDISKCYEVYTSKEEL